MGRRSNNAAEKDVQTKVKKEEGARGRGQRSQSNGAAEKDVQIKL